MARDPNDVLAEHEERIRKLEDRNRGIKSDGIVRASSLAPHRHDASEVRFTPAVAGDWNAGDPGNTDDALDELAERVEDVEGAAGHAQDHASRHAENAADELNVGDLGSTGASAGQVPTADGSGGVAWATPGGGGHTIQDDNSPMTARTNLSLQDGFVVTDDAGGDQTEVDLDYGTTTELADVTKAAESAGSSIKVARADHKHDVTTAAPSTVGTANSEGTATTLARSDHVHAHEAAHVAHDTLWDAKGDSVWGTGADTGGKVSAGANGTVPMYDSAQTAGVKAMSPAMIAWALG